MKTINYNVLFSENRTYQKTIPYSEDNLAIAKQEAYNGEYTIEDDGIELKPTQEERIEALETAILEMLGVALDD